jgi:hypothetical protein
MAMAAKAALAAVTDKNTWKKVLGIAAGAFILVLLPLILILVLASGGAQQTKKFAQVVFSGGSVPAGVDAKDAGDIRAMEDAFAKIDGQVSTLNSEINSDGDGLDGIRIKAVFYVLYFGTDLSGMDDDFFHRFAEAFTIDDGGQSIGVNGDLSAVYQKISALTGHEITDTEKQNIDDLYGLIKYGNASTPEISGIPPDAYDYADFARLMAEATKYIGMRYVWGGSSPKTGFDCSGFVVWCYRESGVYDLPRTTAQGIYNLCEPISPSEAKPGDLVFFTGTYETNSTITHIGIYVGGNTMLHAGDPIGYADLTKSYWQEHCYSFGRISG